MTYPKEKTPVFSALLCLFEALMELDDDETVALSACDGSLDIQLLELVRLPVCASTCLSVYLPVCLVHFKVVQRKLNSYIFIKSSKSLSGTVRRKYWICLKFSCGKQKRELFHVYMYVILAVFYFVVVSRCRR